jgi:hypothetical protein
MLTQFSSGSEESIAGNGWRHLLAGAAGRHFAENKGGACACDGGRFAKKFRKWQIRKFADLKIPIFLVICELKTSASPKIHIFFLTNIAYNGLIFLIVYIKTFTETNIALF